MVTAVLPEHEGAFEYARDLLRQWWGAATEMREASMNRCITWHSSTDQALLCFFKPRLRTSVAIYANPTAPSSNKESSHVR